MDRCNLVVSSSNVPSTMPLNTRRHILTGAAVGLLPELSGAAAPLGDNVIAHARYLGRDESWEISLTDNYTAAFIATLSRLPIGTVRGEFRFYETEFLEKDKLPIFLQLPKSFRASVPSIHPPIYDISVRDKGTGNVHEVSVLDGRAMPPSEGLRVFFEAWRNIWSGVPGYPRAPQIYGG